MLELELELDLRDCEYCGGVHFFYVVRGAMLIAVNSILGALRRRSAVVRGEVYNSCFGSAAGR